MQKSAAASSGTLNYDVAHAQLLGHAVVGRARHLAAAVSGRTEMQLRAARALRVVKSPESARDQILT
jgi:hypothetical protein